MARETVDVLQVALGTTLGQARSDERLRADLEREGLRVATARGRYDRMDAWPRQPFLDLYQAAAARASVERALHRVEPRSILHPSTATALFEPRARLRRSVVRFDNPLRLSRPGPRNIAQWALERRVLRSARALMPYSPRPSGRLLAGAPADTEVISIGYPIDVPASVAEPRDPLVLCYAANPWKKGLDLIARAWAEVDRAGRSLVVTGIGRSDGLGFLAEHGIHEPPDIEWRGRVPAADFDALCARAEVFVSASRREEYGAAQLQALAGGCLLVHAQVPGFCDAYELAAELDVGLTAPHADAEGLAHAIVAALGHEREGYVARARELLRPYTPEAFAVTLHERLVPVLRDCA